jgi:hypothetical protein
MTWKTKLLIILGTLAVIATLGYIIKYQHDIIKKQEDIQKSLVEMKKLPGNVTRAEAEYVTSKDIDALAKNLNLKIDPIRDDLSKLNADVKGIQVISVVSTGGKQSNIPSTSTENRENPPINTNPITDPYNYQKNTQVLQLEEPFSDKKVPIGQVKFSAWRDKPWDLEINKRTYTIINVLGQDENGRHYVYNKFSINTNNKQYDLDIQNAKFVEEYPESKFRFSPRLYLGLDAGTYLKAPEFEFIPNLQLSLFSNGKTKVNPEWTFLGIGAGYEVRSDRFTFMISPINYNIGQYIPFTKNIYIGPSVSFDTNANFAILGGIRIGL